MISATLTSARRNSKLLLYAPGMSPLVAISNDFRQQSRQNAMGLRLHLNIKMLTSVQKWQPYERRAQSYP